MPGTQQDSIDDFFDRFTAEPVRASRNQTLFAELQRVEADTFRHVHVEKHVLRPRFVAA